MASLLEKNTKLYIIRSFEMIYCHSQKYMWIFIIFMLIDYFKDIGCFTNTKKKLIMEC